MADNFFTGDQAAINDVVDGWNERLAMTSSELSKLVPFAELYAIYTPEGSNTVKDHRTSSDAINTTLIDVNGKLEKVQLVPVFKLIEQQTSTTEQGTLLRTRGIPGIESVAVQIQNIQLNGYQINMRVSIPTFETDIQTNNSLRRLMIPNSNWVIAYGWAKDSIGFVDSFQDKNLKLGSTHKGYFRIMKATLMRFDWDISVNKIAEGSLLFLAQANNLFTQFSVNNYRNTILGLIKNPKDMMVKSGLSGILPEQTIIQQTQSNAARVGDSNTTITEKVDGFYYLGWVIEAIKQSMSAEKSEELFSRLNFESYSSTKTIAINTNKDNLSEQVQQPLKNTGWFPIPKQQVDQIINSDDSIMVVISELCSAATVNSQRKAEITPQIAPDGKTLVIRDLNSAVFSNSNNTQMLSVHMSAENSLLSNVQFSSRIDKSLSFGVDIFINTTNGASEILNIFQREANSGSPKSEIAKLIKRFEQVDKPTKASNPNRSERFRQYLQANADIEKIYSEILNSEDVPIGLAMRNYFTNLTLTIHGTAALPPWSHIDFRGVLRNGIDGDYIVFQTTDQLTPGNFVTTLECKLVEPYLQ